MFVVSFFGGLGSQMEQYALYKALKLKYPNVEVKMDIFNLVEPAHNGFELDKVFRIERDEADVRTIQILADFCPHNVKYKHFYNRLNNIRRNVLGYKSSWILSEDPTAYYKEVFELSPLKSYIFHGNWTNKEYWIDIKEELIKDFCFCNDLKDENLKIYNAIMSSNSVSVHIRRGDYIQYGLPILDDEYYKKAFEIIETSVKDPVYFFFSNDMEYVKRRYSHLKKVFFVDGNNGVNSYIDLQLMSKCKHNIIANSTFSRWAPYLNQNKDKVVIGPQNHVLFMKKSFSDDEWISINNKI